jgi:hypothetical protein
MLDLPILVLKKNYPLKSVEQKELLLLIKVCQKKNALSGPMFGIQL